MVAKTGCSINSFLSGAASAAAARFRRGSSYDDGLRGMRPAGVARAWSETRRGRSAAGQPRAAADSGAEEGRRRVGRGKRPGRGRGLRLGRGWQRRGAPDLCAGRNGAARPRRQVPRLPNRDARFAALRLRPRPRAATALDGLST